MVGGVSLGQRLLSLLIIFLFATAVYLYVFPQANVPYAGAVLAHAFLGVLAVALLLFMLPGIWNRAGNVERTGLLLIVVGGVLGVALIRLGTSRPELRVFYAHILVCLAGCAFIVFCRAADRSWLLGRPALRASTILLLFAALGAGGWYVRTVRFQSSARIQNPMLPPVSMDGEGDGPNGKFFPSSAQVKGGGNIPSRFFMESESCKRCHEDIYNQWNSSAHHFSSFNNQWYRKSVEYMQEVVGTKPSKWCGGCHDPAVLYSGLMDTPIKQIVHRPEAQAGLGCMMCHAITDVKSTMGQGDFILEYPKLHELAATKNPVLRAIHDFTIRLNPEPHRRVFLKPFMQKQTAEFCSSCHKVHLDVPVNAYRWIRGFNEYDNWQASGVSFQGSRSFYYPAKAQDCADCHMPKVQSNDFGNIAGTVHSHRFIAANTALPTANEDAEQLRLTEEFLTSKILSVDIFALSPAREIKGGGTAQQEMATSFAVGEEAESKVAGADTGEAAPITAPLNRVQPTVRRGDTVRVDVVVRTKRVGHFFPGGTVDAYDTWLELKGTDDKRQTVFWSGMVEDGGKGPVEKGAHFYRSLLVDSGGHPINKRNAWANRAVVYVRLIPPGAADTVHYRMHVPPNVGDKITLHARLLYRKFAWYNTQFSFAGVPDPAQKNAEVTPDHDDRNFVFTGDLNDVSAKKKEIPDLPAVAIAENEVTLNVASATAPAPQPKVELAAEDWMRWNDYGIGLFLQGDLKGAQAAFQKITEIDPNNADGWVNLGRVAAQEGDMDRAGEVVAKALALKPDLARAHFFYAKVLRNEGRYDEAAQHLRTVLAQYPRDRVVHNELGRIYFLERRYQDAVKEFETTLSVDPEDLQAHYNLMLCYNGLGDEKRAKEHEARYMRFKADEASQAVTGPYRRLNPEDNNERQSIHEHVSVPLPLRPVPRRANVAAKKQSSPAAHGGSR
jgi:tetratricopeptide (TPR) repeat protein